MRMPSTKPVSTMWEWNSLVLARSAILSMTCIPHAGPNDSDFQRMEILFVHFGSFASCYGDID